MNYSSVLIITYGRTGSTLLQGILNSVDDCLVRGENYNFCYGLFEAYEALTNTRAEFGKSAKAEEVTFPWFGAANFDEQKFLADARQLVLRQLCPEGSRPACIGFKEIRYLRQYLTGTQKDQRPRLHEYLDFLQRLLPNPAFLVLTRDHEEVTKSGWWREMSPEQVIEQINAFEHSVGAYAAANTNVFSITYRDLVERSERLREMFAFLGAEYDEERLGEVLAVKHSYTTGAHQTSGTQARARTGRSKPRLRNMDAAKVQHVEIHSGPRADETQPSAPLTGVIVPPPDFADDSARLIAVDGQGEHEMEWGLPSPRMVDKWPDNARAATSRFRCAGLSLELDTPATVFLQLGDGTRHPLFEVIAAAAPEAEPEP